MMYPTKVDIMSQNLRFGPGLSWFSGISVEQIISYSLGRKFIFWCSVSLSAWMGIIIKSSSLITLLGVRRKLRIEETFAISSLAIGSILTGVTIQKGHSQLYFIQTALIIAAPIAAVIFFRARELQFFPTKFLSYN